MALGTPFMSFEYAVLKFGAFSSSCSGRARQPVPWTAGLGENRKEERKGTSGEETQGNDR